MDLITITTQRIMHFTLLHRLRACSIAMMYPQQGRPHGDSRLASPWGVKPRENRGPSAQIPRRKEVESATT